jgi:FkbM family methyltransferase
MDVWSIKETFLDDFYRFERIVKTENPTIIDIGAGIGEFTIQAAAACPAGKVYGFEPYPESFSFFEKNVALNGLKNVYPIGVAITSIPGNMVLDTSSGNPLQYRMQQGNPEEQDTSINAITLMDFLNQEAIEKCDILKLDCEGGEYDILLPLSIKDLVRFKGIVMEYHDSLTPHNHKEIVQLLKSAGFRVENIPNQVHSDLGYIYAQYI